MMNATIPASSLRSAAALPSLAAAASRWAASLSSGRPFSAAAAGGAPPPPAGDAQQPYEEDEKAASLPVEQLAKALLAGNARGQLTTIKAGEPGAEDSKVSSSVTPYVSLRGEAPVVLLGPADVEHLANLGESAKVGRAGCWGGGGLLVSCLSCAATAAAGSACERWAAEAA